MGAGPVSIVIVEGDSVEGSSLVNDLWGLGIESSRHTLEEVRWVDRSSLEVVVLRTERPIETWLRACRALRSGGCVSGILAVVEDRTDGLALLEAGADDFVVWPVQPVELAGRVRAALRRGVLRWTGRSAMLEVDRVRRLVLLRGRRLTLTPREFDVLSSLVEAAGRTVSRADLFARVWGPEKDTSSNLLEVHLSRIRDKLGPDAALIETVRGSGYRMR